MQSITKTQFQVLCLQKWTPREIIVETIDTLGARIPLGDASGKEPTCQCRRYKRLGFNPQLRKISWRRAWQPTQVLLPGESHGQRSLAGYSPRGSQRVCQIWLKWLSTHRYCNEYEEILISNSCTHLPSTKTLI